MVKGDIVMNNIYDKGDYCCGCGVCSVVCPTKAITMEEKDGFYFPKINEDRCVKCGICKQSCTKYGNIKTEGTGKSFYAIKCKNKNILAKSSSGGVSHGLMNEAINNGYKIIACEYSLQENCAVHTVAENTSEISKYYGSKYMQSRFWEAINIQDLKVGKYLIIGTPCQIYAVSRILERLNIREKFLLVDFFCHGTPSKKIWDNALNNIKQKYGNVKDVEFRSKIRGWSRFVNVLKTENSKIVEKEHFYDLFFSDAVLNKSCYQCSVRKSFDYCDIKIGDFWGDKFVTDNEGVSVVCVCSKRGSEFINDLKEDYEITEVDDSFKKYQALSNQDFDEKKYEAMIQYLNNGQNNSAYKFYKSTISVKSKIMLIMRKIFDKMPFIIRAKLKALRYKL